ncbi:hypothetical protein VK792_04335 [Mesobacterium sp. TK19101]|uniref:DUF997 domain-containing protein n=1 Tax=Mesobacterium hydrothermale TaxID=3111907 RepID=A0ABU6HEG1_9RHOB|nr:hypothetical protein [Mesobacterium sp. TK19101]MEC3860502.1 hypothetical protein [Mesobacterium sp. TK19101]
MSIIDDEDAEAEFMHDIYGVGADDREPKVSRSGPAYWPFGKLVAVLWAIIFGAVFLNIFVIYSASGTFGGVTFSLWLVMLWVIPITLIAALWLARWVRGLVEREEAI